MAKNDLRLYEAMKAKRLVEAPKDDDLLDFDDDLFADDVPAADTATDADIPVFDENDLSSTNDWGWDKISKLPKDKQKLIGDYRTKQNKISQAKNLGSKLSDAEFDKMSDDELSAEIEKVYKVWNAARHQWKNVPQISGKLDKAIIINNITIDSDNDIYLGTKKQPGIARLFEQEIKKQMPNISNYKVLFAGDSREYSNGTAYNVNNNVYTHTECRVILMPEGLYASHNGLIKGDEFVCIKGTVRVEELLRDYSPLDLLYLDCVVCEAPDKAFNFCTF